MLVWDYEFENIAEAIFQYYGISYELEKTKTEMKKFSKKGYDYLIITKSNRTFCETIESLSYYDRYYRDEAERNAYDTIIRFCISVVRKILEDDSLIKYNDFEKMRKNYRRDNRIYKDVRKNKICKEFDDLDELNAYAERIEIKDIQSVTPYQKDGNTFYLGIFDIEYLIL